MPETRRRWLMAAAGSSLALMAGRLGFAQYHPEPQPLPSPNAPNPAYPPGLNGPEQTREPNVKPVDPMKQVELKKEVDRLFQLVTELKKEVDATDATSTLSLSVVKKAQEAEKLAKQIKNLTKG